MSQSFAMSDAPDPAAVIDGLIVSGTLQVITGTDRILAIGPDLDHAAGQIAQQHPDNVVHLFDVMPPQDAYEQALKDLRPTLLILKLGGDELAFLHAMAVPGLRAIIVAFDRSDYGKAGLRSCKTLLRAAGFEKTKACSTRDFWVCTRDLPSEAPLPTDSALPPAPQPDPAQQPSPFGGWSETAEICANALVVPPDGGAMIQATGVLRSDGSYVAQGALWRRHRPITSQPEPPEGVADQLQGRWLFGGPLWHHFGHFLTESLTRLWASEGFGHLDGILFTPKRAANGSEIAPYHHTCFDAFGLALPVKVLTSPTQVENLVVPGQGFGLGPISVGTPSFRSFVRTRFAQAIPAQGPERLYISRSNIGPRRGGFLAEQMLEAQLSQQGYEIFHPQDHPLDVQIAHYKAARQIIAAEGSALHLVGMVAHADQQIAMIMRRHVTGTDPITAHISAFSGRKPTNVTAIRRRWMPAKGGRAHQGVAEIDLAAAQKQLCADGFIAAGEPWTSLSESEAQEMINAERYWRINKFKPV